MRSMVAEFLRKLVSKLKVSLRFSGDTRCEKGKGNFDTGWEGDQTYKVINGKGRFFCGGVVFI